MLFRSDDPPLKTRSNQVMTVRTRARDFSPRSIVSVVLASYSTREDVGVSFRRTVPEKNVPNENVSSRPFVSLCPEGKGIVWYRVWSVLNIVLF